MRKNLIIVLAVLCVGYVAWNKLSKEDNTERIYGNVDIREASPSFEITGRVAAIKALEGAKVKKGDVLAELDTTSLQLKLKGAELAVATAEENLLRLKNGSRPQEKLAANAQKSQAKASLELARLTYNRKKGVFDRTNGSGVSRAELDEARTRLDSAEAQLTAATANADLVDIGPRAEDIAVAEKNLESARNQVAIIQDQISKSVLKAPEDGIIRSRFIELGDLTGGSARAYSLALTSEKRVRVYASYNMLSGLHVGSLVNIYLGTGNEVLKGQVTFISSTAEFTPKNVETEELRPDLVYEVQAVADDPNDMLKLGMPVTVEVVKDADSATAPVPAAASAQDNAKDSSIGNN